MSSKMKKIFWVYVVIVIFSFITVSAFAGTCTTVSRSNFTFEQILTSSDLNTQFNDLYNAHNAYDGGCITDGTLEDGALNTTDFAVPLNALKEGFECSRSDTNTVAVGKGRISVNGNWITDSDGGNVTWACSGCSAEASDSTFYVYAKTGTSLDLLIDTTAPGVDGYNGTSKVLCEFYNDKNSDIASGSVESWVRTDFSPRDQVTVRYGNGHGSTANKIRRFQIIQRQSGGAITYADSATNGATFTINEDGLYHITYCDRYTTAETTIGITKNTGATTVSIISLTGEDVIGFQEIPGDNIGCIHRVAPLENTDVIRPHNSGTPNGTGFEIMFSITKIGK